MEFTDRDIVNATKTCNDPIWKISYGDIMSVSLKSHQTAVSLCVDGNDSRTVNGFIEEGEDAVVTAEFEQLLPDGSKSYTTLCDTCILLMERCNERWSIPKPWIAVTALKTLQSTRVIDVDETDTPQIHEELDALLFEQQSTFQNSLDQISKDEAELLRTDHDQLTNLFHYDCSLSTEHHVKVRITIPVDRLGITEHGKRVWNVHPDAQYLVVVAKFPFGLYSYLKGHRSSFHGDEAQFCVFLSDQPSMNNFPETLFKSTGISSASIGEYKGSTVSLFAFASSSAIHHLLNERFVAICKRLSTPRNDGSFHSLANVEKYFHTVIQAEKYSPGKVEPDSTSPTEPEKSTEVLNSIEQAELQLQATNPLLVLICYVRRQILVSTKTCLICHEPDEKLESLIPFVCDKELCVYTCMTTTGRDIECEIMSNGAAVDLLICFCYGAAKYTGNHAEFVPHPSKAVHDSFVDDSDAKVPRPDVIVELLARMPSVETMQQQISAKKNLRDFLKSIDERLYVLLRWILFSNRTHLQLASPIQRVDGLTDDYLQFIMQSGTRESERLFQVAKANAKHDAESGSFFAFHGSPYYNWHSIVRRGLHAKKTAFGRAYGNGIYHAHHLATSTSYAAPQLMYDLIWPNSQHIFHHCVAINELVSDTSKFVSVNPYYVVPPDLNYVQTRYLIVKFSPRHLTETTSAASSHYHVHNGPNFKLYGVTGQLLSVPTSTHQMFSDSSREIALASYGLTKKQQKLILEASTTNPKPGRPAKDELEEDAANGRPASVKRKCTHSNSIPEPSVASSAATRVLMREWRALLKSDFVVGTASQPKIISIPNSDIGDNIYLWHVNLCNFDKDLPLSKDLHKHGITEVELEIRFSPTFNMTPPYIRVVRPRFLPFSQGGGGHVTLGGSICSDLLTSNGWQPTYSLDTVLLIVYTSLSSLDPRPARLSANWKTEYSSKEAIDAYLRVARDHNWEVPQGWGTLMM